MRASWMSFEKPGANVIGCRLQSILAGNTFRPTLCDLTTFLRRVVSLANWSALHADRRIPDGHAPGLSAGDADAEGATPQADCRIWTGRRARGDIVQEIIAIVRQIASGLPPEQPNPLDDGLPGG